MKIDLTFLTASVPLVKRIEMHDGVIVKHGYPKVVNLTSSVVKITSIRDMYDAIKHHALLPKAPCLFKGELVAPLNNESRRDMGKSGALTQYVVLDFDDAPFSSPAEAMKALSITASYVWQYSSSAKLGDKKTLSGHAFMILDEPVSPLLLRSWFLHCNMRVEALKNALTLSSAKQALHYPLDIVVSMNNRMVYIGEPTFKNMKSPIPPTERIQLIKGKEETLSVKSIPEHSYEALQQEARDHIKRLRGAEGLPMLKSKLKMVGEWEVQTGIGAATTYQVIDDGGEFIRYNINNGDSQAYWHPRHSFEYLHNFKGEPSVLTKELMPDRYAEMCRAQSDGNAAPSEDGDLLLAYREKVTGKYWKGIWNPGTFTLDIHPVNAIIDLEHFMLQHGRTMGAFVPEWHMIYDPREKWVVNPDTRMINTFVPPPYMRGREESSTRKTTFPIIQKFMDHAIGKGLIQEHFLNWLACIMQYRRKTGTAWILHGTQGTGKGVLVDEVLRPIFTEQYMMSLRPDEVTERFNSWSQRNLLVYVNEVEVDLFTNRSAVEARLKMSITDRFMAVREMRKEARATENFLNMIFSSNKPQPVQIPMNDRRFNVGVFQKQEITTTTEEIYKMIPQELEAFSYYLLTREADTDKAAKVLQTEDRAMIQSLGVTSIDEFANDIVTGNLLKLWEYMPDERMLDEHGLINAQASAYAAIMRRFALEETSKISRDELLLMFSYAIGDIKQGPNKFTMFLRHRGIVVKKIWHNNATMQGIEITWINKPEYAVPAEPQKLRKVK